MGPTITHRGRRRWRRGPSGRYGKPASLPLFVHDVPLFRLGQMVNSVIDCGPFGGECSDRQSYSLNNLNRLPSTPGVLPFCCPFVARHDTKCSISSFELLPFAPALRPARVRKQQEIPARCFLAKTDEGEALQIHALRAPLQTNTRAFAACSWLQCLSPRHISHSLAVPAHVTSAGCAPVHDV